MNNKNNQLIGHIVYKGPYVNDGSIDLLKLSDSLRSFYFVFNEVKKELGITEDFIIKAGNIKKGSSDVTIYIQPAIELARGALPLATALTISKIAKEWGVPEIVKPIFREIGELIKAKIFTKNDKYVVKQNDAKIENERTFVKIINSENKEEYFDYKIFLLSRNLKILDKFIPITKNELEEVVVEYEENSERRKVLEVNTETHEYLKYSPDTKELEDKVRAKIRLVDNKGGNGKLWLDEAKKESCNFEIDIKDIGKLEKVISSLALAEGKNEWVLISGRKEYRGSKLFKIYIEDIDLLGGSFW
ncbi:MAG: hypothetical protein WC938_02170 [Candidatus Paceibacterota bacterium]|jgi:hypothetical protein